MSPARDDQGAVTEAPPEHDDHRDPVEAEREEHPDSFDPGLETGYLRRGRRDHELDPDVGAAPFDPGEELYDSRRAKREARRREKAEQKRRAQAEKLEAERREREKAEAERIRREEHERVERQRKE